MKKWLYDNFLLCSIDGQKIAFYDKKHQMDIKDMIKWGAMRTVSSVHFD